MIDHYEAEVISANDYYPFGMMMPGRKFSSSGSYRYGFNGKENDNDVKGVEGSQQDYGFRIYDPRLGRFLSVDPLTTKYPMLTPYQFASNTPIMAIDLDGKEALVVTGSFSGFFGFLGGETGAGLAITPSGISIIQSSNIKIGGGVYLGAAINFTYLPEVKSALDLEGFGIGLAADAADFLSYAGSVEYTSAGWAFTLSAGGGAGVYGGLQGSFTTVLKTFTWKQIFMFIAEKSENPEIAKYLIEAFDLTVKDQISAFDLLQGYKKVVNEFVNQKVRNLNSEIDKSKGELLRIESSLNEIDSNPWYMQVLSWKEKLELKGQKNSNQKRIKEMQDEIKILKSSQKKVNDLKIETL